MSQAVIMIYINIINFALTSWLEKDHSMIETCHLQNVIFFQTYYIVGPIQTKGGEFSFMTKIQ